MKPIEINNGRSIKKSSSMNKMKYGRKPISSGPSYTKGKGGTQKRPPTAKRAEPVAKRENVASGWDNTNTTDSKFFDKKQDKDYMRKHQRGGSANKARTVANAKSKTV